MQYNDCFHEHEVIPRIPHYRAKPVSLVACESTRLSLQGYSKDHDGVLLFIFSLCAMNSIANPLSKASRMIRGRIPPKLLLRRGISTRELDASKGGELPLYFEPRDT